MSDAPAPSHPHQTPRPVDFRQIAQQALDAGIFAQDLEAQGLNATNRNLSFPFPVRMLEQPYGNGPMEIERLKKDVPEAVMNRVRKNWVKANELLLPNEQVLSYFHQRFSSQDVFQSPSIQAVMQKYRSPTVSNYKDYKDDALSFKVEGVDRTSSDRNLFTREEMIAAINLTREQPSLVLSIVGYQAAIQDYLNQLGNTFRELAAQPGSKIKESDIKDFERFTQQWKTSNFTNELIPALALYLAVAKQANPGVATDALITQELFKDSVNFVISNGVFRNWVTVPAAVAQDGKERVNRFNCPAANTIRGQLLDGALLHNIYRITEQQLKAGDRTVVELANIVKAGEDYKIESMQQKANLTKTSANQSGAAEKRIDEHKEHKLPGLARAQEAARQAAAQSKRFIQHINATTSHILHKPKNKGEGTSPPGFS